MALSDLTAEAVTKAIEEFDQLGREAFLQKYQFGQARGYILQQAGKSYDSKAIAGAAHGYLLGQKALSADEFSGGTATVQKVLEALGFMIVHPDLPSPGDVLNNNEISQQFVVGNMGGMRRSSTRNLLVLISDPFKGLYQDRWEGDVLHYTGMGPTGDQSLTYAQNRTLAESSKTGVPVHLLEAHELQRYTYAGEVQLIADPYQEEQLDDLGQNRKVWMFSIRLKPGGVAPVLTETEARAIEESQAKKARQLSMAELKARAAKAKKTPAQRTTQTSVYVRDAAVAEYVKRLAKGHCDLCGQQAPFENKQNEAYLECHHINWLAKGGEDTTANTVALCPNCHRKMHVLNRKADREKLMERAAARDVSETVPSSGPSAATLKALPSQ
jgi:5-methylcytosine-specific restriction protein A